QCRELEEIEAEVAERLPPTPTILTLRERFKVPLTGEVYGGEESGSIVPPLAFEPWGATTLGTSLIPEDLWCQDENGERELLPFVVEGAPFVDRFQVDYDLGSSRVIADLSHVSDQPYWRSVRPNRPQKKHSTPPKGKWKEVESLKT